MIKLFIDSFKITNDCIILATPLILFLTLLGLYTAYAGYAADDPIKLFLSLVTLLIMFCGFLSAWLYMAKKTLAMHKRIFLFDKDRLKALLSLIASLPKGVGRLLLPITGVIGLYIILFLILFSAIAFWVTTSTQLADYSQEMWIISLSVIMFVTILWIPEIVYNEKNVLKALFYSIIKVFFNFKNCLILYCYIAVLLCANAYLYIKLSMHPILTFFILILFYYILVYIIVLLFTYYERTFIKE